MAPRFKQILLFAALVACANLAVACPTCKESLEHDPTAMSMARGYFWSILFMMSIPFLTLGGLGSYFYYEVLKARRVSGKPSPDA